MSFGIIHHTPFAKKKSRIHFKWALVIWWCHVQWTNCMMRTVLYRASSWNIHLLESPTWRGNVVILTIVTGEIFSVTEEKFSPRFTVANFFFFKKYTTQPFPAINLFWCWCLRGLIGPIAVCYMLFSLWKTKPSENHLAIQTASANWHSNKAESCAVCCTDWWTNMKSSLPFPIVRLFNQT